MNVLSLFDGMGGGRIALERAGIKVKNYYAAEIDKYAMQVAASNYPDIHHIGDVTKVHGNKLPKIDLLIGGSPCQGFSFAGKQLNFDDPRSKLFWEYVRLLKECKPKYFLLENVRMKQEYQDIMSEALGAGPIAINSRLVSAQNRYRLYWTNIPNVTQPADKGIMLKDIVEYGVVDRDKGHCLDANYHKGGNLKSYLKKHRRQIVFSAGQEVAILQRGRGVNTGGVKALNGKVPAMTASSYEHNNHLLLGGAIRGRYLVNGEGQGHKGSVAGKTKQRLEINKTGKSNALTSVQKDNVVVACGGKQFIPSGTHKSSNGLIFVGGLAGTKKWLDDGKNLQRNYSQGERVYSTDGKSPTLSAHSGGTAGAGSALIRVGTADEVNGHDCNKRVYSPEGKTPSLAAASGGNLEPKVAIVPEATKQGFVEIPPNCGVDLTFPNSKTRRGRKMGEKSNCLTAATHDMGWYNGITYRKLTPLECERLQTVPDNYTNHVSNSQRYKMLGNGWTIDVIAHIFENIKLNLPPKKPMAPQLYQLSLLPAEGEKDQ